MDGIDIIEDFNVLRGFKFFRAYESPVRTKDKNGNEQLETFATVIEFRNDNQVGIDITFIDGEYFIDNPYAVDVDMQRLKEYNDKV